MNSHVQYLLGVPLNTGGLIQDFRHMDQYAFLQYLIFFNSETCVLPHWSWGTPEIHLEVVILGLKFWVFLAHAYPKDTHVLYLISYHYQL